MLVGGAQIGGAPHCLESPLSMDFKVEPLLLVAVIPSSADRGRCDHSACTVTWRSDVGGM